MKVAIPLKEKEVNEFFGRTEKFLLVEIKENKITKKDIINNLSSQQNTGAGLSTAKSLVEKGIEALIVVNLGPRACAVLKQFKVKIYTGKGSVDKVIDDFIKNKLKEI
ncbi:MAG: NifB/NifX family molybdenum-iron cluster-binding protein [Candidatus Aenigmarchaeota archaeon]|nr:NifB/NifX family molybdenum-iron cluster-binding protein [Candidatus Aenigmarchaeota archaeon]